MTETRNWREAKPKWVVEAAEAEMAAMETKLALRWPEEPRPVPVPFSWGGYDGVGGDPVEGEYFNFAEAHYSAPPFVRSIRIKKDAYRWIFTINGGASGVVRGPLYATRKEAALAALWNECDKAAIALKKTWQLLDREVGK